MANDSVGYIKTYKMRRVIAGRNYVTVAIPYEVVERQARMVGMGVNDFIDRYVAVAEYDGFEGVRYTFKLSEANDGKTT